ncbi:MAG: SMC-Scp complex subunit ScpB [Clostridium sp.]|uniref:SMC-Scp complex subunit ScpB n=1 Tax=Clostridium sp. TaxID=1506 RepID=UPI002A86D4F5|nr:SMC-Scp complex subunit ScpB [Clostridium sp.]MDY5098226.1 SMC-Scp complex subunit ScpB [Clostridium sp.]
MDIMSQCEIRQVYDRKRYISIIESLLFASGDPMKVKDIASILECSEKYTKEVLEELRIDYGKEERGIKVVCINNTYQLVTKPENSDYIQKILKTNSRQSLSQAAIESLAIIAYKQPITRVEIDEIRGVKSESALQKLLERNLIKECGRKEVIGRPILYGTTDEFLRQFQLENLKELPTIEELSEKEIALADTNDEE